MTALAAFFALIPMALALERGSEANAPLGRAILGGLLAGLVTTLFVVPSLYSLVVKGSLSSREIAGPVEGVTRSRAGPARSSLRLDPLHVPDRDQARAQVLAEVAWPRNVISFPRITAKPLRFQTFGLRLPWNTARTTTCPSLIR